MYPCRGVLHTPHKCPHRRQTNSPIWIDRPICLSVLTPSIPEIFIPNNFRSLPWSFVGRMQYAPTVIRKCYAMICSIRSIPGSFVGRMQYAPTVIRKWYMMIRSFRSLPGPFVGRMQYAPTMIRKCYAIIRSIRSLPRLFVGRMQYASTLPNEKRRSQNTFAVLFEAQNRVQMILRYFLRLKIESKCFCGAFWVSKSNQNVFGVLFEAQNRVKMFLRCFLRLKIESKCFWGAFWG